MKHSFTSDAHLFSLLWTNFGSFGDQSVHVHPCSNSDCDDAILVGEGRTCAGKGSPHKIQIFDGKEWIDIQRSEPKAAPPKERAPTWAEVTVANPAPGQTWAEVKASIYVRTTRPTSGVLLELLDERKAQDRRFGGPSHDDEHELGDWLDFIRKQMQVGGRTNTFITASQRASYRAALVKAGALAIAALEAFDRRSIK